MREIAQHIANALDAGRDTVLVTIVGNKGSAPRHVGSQMLVSAEGLTCGTIGGGAIEAHGIALAREMAGQGAWRFEDLELEANLGMACGGAACLLYAPICAGDEQWRSVANEALNCFNRRIPAFLALKLPREGGSFEGAVALSDARRKCVAGDGEALSELLGCAEHPTPDEPFSNAQATRAEKYAHRKCPCPVGDFFVMPLPIPERAIVFGGGHVGRATISALSRVGFSCTLFDDRPEFADPKANPAAREVILGDYVNIAETLSLDARDYVLIMTSGHASDIAVLGQALQRPLAYVGMIGSRKKIATAWKILLEQGIPESALDAVHMPIGLDIQAETPEEIAVSIAAECILHRANRSKEQPL